MSFSHATRRTLPRAACLAAALCVMVAGLAAPAAVAYAYTITDLGTLPNLYSSPSGINASGQVVGYAWGGSCGAGRERPFLWEGGVMTDLGTLGGNFSEARLINDAGQVVGTSDTAVFPDGDGWNRGPDHAFLWDHGVMHDLGTLVGPYGKLLSSTAFDMNSTGLVVSAAWQYADVPLWWGGGAFLWDRGVMTNLNSLIPAESGWELGAAMAINDAGQIVGVGRLHGSDGGRAFLLTPVTDDAAPPPAG